MLGGCGGGDGADAGAQPSDSEIAQCLNAGGAVAEPLASKAEGELIGAQAPDGEVILIFNLSDPGMSKEALPVLKKALRESSGHGTIKISQVNGGSTLVGVVGIVGVSHGTISGATEVLAQKCATSS